MQFEKEMTPIDHLYTRFISQLDSLIPFLGLAHEEIFKTLQENYIGWFSDEQQPTAIKPIRCAIANSRPIDI